MSYALRRDTSEARRAFAALGDAEQSGFRVETDNDAESISRSDVTGSKRSFIVDVTSSGDVAVFTLRGDDWQQTTLGDFERCAQSGRRAAEGRRLRAHVAGVSALNGRL